MARDHRKWSISAKQLHTLIDEHETTLEEFKSANAEILSANEELQSTNEELETTKEELQSSNEELSTLNEELQNSNAELTQSNNDQLNLMTNVNLPVVMVGNDLRIRRFTPPAEKLLNLLARGCGQAAWRNPVQHRTRRPGADRQDHHRKRACSRKGKCA